ncbi:hypothetical protein GCM10027271_24620 [Saccharopolyspora gloriosae]|uniref:Uncharacterized protein n=1 Tax=Saccharopolyspora gloriosae TaxID=455344 RepID=A0A840NR17_9PSEU|nr:hypothetical protein [Saccharopolyspora gloriosae]MBB5071699.1 hypothetical protein [Saccharopolyspora gloriosae]
MRTSTRLLGATAVAVALLGAGSTAAFAGGDDDKPSITSESGDGGSGGSGGTGLNLLCGIGILGEGTCTAADGGNGGDSDSETGVGNEG